MTTIKTAAIYLRVSSKLKGAAGERECRQTVENQRLQLEKYAQAVGWNVVHVFEDHDSGAKAARPGFISLMDAAARHEFDVTLVWSLDRFGREGIAKTLGHLKQLADYKVAFRSFNEPFLDTTGDFGDLLIALFAFFASFERKRTIERIVAGQQRAKAQGKRIGGHNKLVFDRGRVSELRAQGLSLQKIADQLKVSKGTVINALKEA
jgi:DNA invertase Pin-like site-specific DNA recombinase